MSNQSFSDLTSQQRRERIAAVLASHHINLVYPILRSLFQSTRCFAGASMSSNDEQNPWVIRTCFSDDQTWALIKKQVAAPQRDPLSGMDFTANVRFVEDPAFANLSSHEIVRSLPADYPGYVAFVVDTESTQGHEHSLLVVGFAPQGDTPENFERKPNQVPLEDIRSFRAIPSTIQSIENNLSIANMDFDDFRTAVGTDGVFRGF
jgi:hypothetical protein